MGVPSDERSQRSAKESWNEEVAHRLDSLKQSGCNILVAGSVPPAVTFHATRNLLGSDYPVSRHRLLACTDLHPPGNHYLWTGYKSSPRRLSAPVLERSLASVEGMQSHASLPDPTDWLTTFQQSLCTAIDEANAADDGIEPGQLRLSMLTLRPIIESVCYDRADRFLRAVTGHIDGVSGMAHYHLPVAYDADLVDRHADHFDVHIELRNPDGRPAESRWHFGDDVATTWHTL